MKLNSKSLRCSMKKKLSLLLALVLLSSAASVAFFTLDASTIDASAAVSSSESVGGSSDSNYDGYIPSNFPGEILAVEATYIDFLSDYELSSGSGGWLNTRGNDYDHNNKDEIANMWFQFDTFNQYISSIASNNSSWTFPLYFGNLFKGQDKNADGTIAYDWYNTCYSHAGSLTRSYISSDNNYYYAVNNSNGMTWQLNNSNAYYYSLTGLVGKTLNSDGLITANDGTTVLPYFNADSLYGTKYAKVFKSYFPFTITQNSDGTTTYDFNSANAEDNVYFTWNGSTPVAVNYGSGTGYAVKDYLNSGSFGGESDGYGLFPFNNNDNTKTTTVGGEKTQISSDNIIFVKDASSWGNVLMWAWDSNNNGEWYYPEYDSTYGLYYFVNSQTGSNGEALSSKTKFLLTNNTSYSSENYKDQSLSSYYGYLLYTDTTTNYKTTSGRPSYETAVVGGTTYTKTIGNDNVDYGFAIQLDMDFRYKSGATFEFSGDDDLWVYITDSNGNSKLALDLGGDHKQANGKITFSSNSATGTSTNVFADYSSGSVSAYNGSSKSITLSDLSEDETYHMTVFYMERGESESNCHISFSMTPITNNLEVEKIVDTTDVNAALCSATAAADEFNYSIDGTSENDTITYSYNSKNGTSDKTLTDKKFNLYDSESVDFATQYTAGGTVTVNETGVTGKADTYLSSRYTTYYTLKDNKSNKYYNGSSWASSSTNLTGTSATFAFAGENTASDPNLTLAYTNKVNTGDLQIAKKVYKADGTTQITDSSTLSNIDITYKVGIDLNGGENYSYYPLEYTIGNNTEKYKASSDGTITAKANEVVKISGIPAGATFKVEETACSSPYVNMGDDAKGRIAANETSSVTFNNKANTGSLSITKSVVDASGNATTDTETEFTFNVTFEPALSSFNYTIGNGSVQISYDGTVTIKAGQTATITDIPADTKYEVTEDGVSGYTLRGITVDGTTYNGVTSASGIISQNNTSAVTFTNRKSSGAGTVKINKNLDDKYYTGKDFSFTIEGLNASSGTYSVVNGVDMSGKKTTSNSQVSNATVTFTGGDALTFDKAGVYRYKIYENTEDTLDNVEYDDTVYYVQFTVVEKSGVYSIDSSTLKYYTDEFITDTGDDGTPFFNNYTKKVSVNAIKLDKTTNTSIEGAEFTIYKVSAVDADDELIEANKITTATTESDKDEITISKNSTDTTTTYATFENLSIYKTQSNGLPDFKTYQVYCVVESKAPSGYALNSSMKEYFTLEDYNTDTASVNVTCYDSLLVMPETSGSGVISYFIWGISIISAGALLVAAYLLCNRKLRRKQKNH